MLAAALPVPLVVLGDFVFFSVGLEDTPSFFEPEESPDELDEDPESDDPEPDDPEVLDPEILDPDSLVGFARESFR